MQFEWIDLAKMVLAIILGFIIGFQRELRHKPAGITTITLVTLASTLVMIISQKLHLASQAQVGGDPARLAAAILTGVGFLGAGVIIQTRKSVHGITTAATIWLMAAVGLGIGLGYFIEVLIAVALALLGFIIDPYTKLWVEAHRRRMSLSNSETDEDADDDDLF